MPTFGRPTIAMRMPVKRSRSGAPPTSSSTRSIRSPTASPWSADTANGSPNPRLYISGRLSAARVTSLLVATRITGSDARRSKVAISSSEEVTPDTPSTRKSTASASLSTCSTPARTCGPKGIVVGPHQATGVDDADVAAAPFEAGVVAVPRGAGEVLDERAVGARQPVEQRGLAHVRAADDGDEGQWHAIPASSLRAQALLHHRHEPARPQPARRQCRPAARSGRCARWCDRGWCRYRCRR